VLHDAFRKGMEDPVHMKVVDQFDQQLAYMSSEEYARFARETFSAERATMERLRAAEKKP
jgi:hypothetical protein